MPKNDKIPTDLVDELRSNLNKIGKLAPDLDAWHRTLATTAEQTHAAMAVMTAIEQMRTSLRALRGYAQEVADAKIEQDKAAQDTFFDRDEL